MPNFPLSDFRRVRCWVWIDEAEPVQNKAGLQRRKMMSTTKVTSKKKRQISGKKGEFHKKGDFELRNLIISKENGCHKKTHLQASKLISWIKADRRKIPHFSIRMIVCTWKLTPSWENSRIKDRRTKVDRSFDFQRARYAPSLLPGYQDHAA